ncbi:hypothetical protein J8J40_32425, partial [Mycobacterium tuberculosis]|nr:hypothetical protein [Mycobacterium tuberculosis]
CWDTIVTSGDATTELIGARGPIKIHNIGPDRDLGLYDGTEAVLVPAERAELIVVTGLFDDDTETPETYRAGFEAMIARGLPM